MRLSRTRQLDLDPEEQFTFEYDGRTRRVRMLSYNEGAPTVTVYAARVYKNGSVTGNSMPFTWPIQDSRLSPEVRNALGLPEVVQQ